MKAAKAISDVQDAERELAKQLRAVGERHAVEHDLYHLGHTLAKQCADHLERLAPFAERYGTSAQTDGVAESPGVVETLRHKTSELLGRSEATGLLLLHDLRSLYLAAQEAEIDWVVLGQVAHAIRDEELLFVCTECREDAEERAKWLRTRIKESCAQVLATG